MKAFDDENRRIFPATAADGNTFNDLKELGARDRRHIWHPFTQAKIAENPLPIRNGEGVYLIDDQGNRYVDMISSWWVNLHGHGNPVIAKAIYRQAQRLEQVIFAGFTHEPAIELCEKLHARLPFSLEKFFFSDNGSTAVEIALKMSYQFWKNQGQNRPLFLTFEGGYHGDTFGAMSVGSRCGFHDTFRDFFFQTLAIPFPETWENDGQMEIKERESLEKLDIILAQNAKKIAAMILEPLVQGASGMRFCRPEFLKSCGERLRSAGVLVIFDEVMTGFYRTGSLFALEQATFFPDILCLSKGLTGGFLPLALTIATKRIYESFLGDSMGQAFLHGHSYSANPLACAAALASLQLLQWQTIQNLMRWQAEGMSFLAKSKIFDRQRQRGTITAFRCCRGDAKTLTKRMQTQGFILRPLGDQIYTIPPYCIQHEQLMECYRALAAL